MRLGLVIYGSLSELSGGFLYDRQLTAGFEALGHEVEVLALPWRRYGPSLTDNFDRALIHRLSHWEVDALLQDELCHPSLFLLNRRLPIRDGRPIVSIVHHLRSSENHSPPLSWLYRWIERQYLRTVDGYLFNSHPTRSAVQHLRGQPTSGVVAPPGRDHLQHLKGSIRPSGTSRATGPLRVLFVGSLIRRKGLHLLLDALEQLEGDWRLQIAGRPDLERSYARQLLARLSTPPFVANSTFHGAVDHAELKDLYRQADVLAVPSTHEGFGIVYLEAMGFGLPVLASRAGGASDLVSHGENGYLVDPGSVEQIVDALRRYRDDPSQRDAHGQAAKMRFEAHPTWLETAATAVNFLEKEVLGKDDNATIATEETFKQRQSIRRKM